MSYLKKTRVFWLILVLVLVLTSCNSSSTKTSNLVNKKQNKVVQNQEASKKWISDIDYLRDKLIKTHPNPFFKLSKKDFNDKLDKLKKDVPYLEDYQIKLTIKEILALIGDDHTNAYLDMPNQLYPIGLWWFGKDLRVISIDKDYTQVLGMKLKEINGIPIEKVLNNINKLIPHVNNQSFISGNPDLFMRPDVLKYYNITSDDKHIFKFEDDSKKEVSLNLSPKDISSIKPVRLNNGYINRPNQKDDGVFGFNEYWFKLVPTDKILYFQFNNCMDKKSAEKTGYIKDYNSYPDFSIVSEKFKAAISKNKIDKLIIDMSNNPGGDFTMFTDLLHTVTYNPDLIKKGKLFVIIGRNTYSAAIYYSLTLQSTNAILIGEATGGQPNMFTCPIPFTLPNSKIQVLCPTGDRYSYPDNTLKLGNTLNPDVSVQQSFEDYKKGIDDVYEAIKNYKN